MDRIIPFDQIGLPSPGRFQNAAPSSGIEGSIVNADFFEVVQGELLNLQDEAGLTRNVADLTQILQAIRSGKLTAFADTGTADALVVTPRTAYTALGIGVPIQVLKNNAPNATTTPTLSVNGLVRQIVKEDGSALAVGDLPGASLFSVISDGSKLRVVGLRKSDAAAAAAIAVTNSTSISTTIQNFINSLTPNGATQISAFTPAVAANDIAVTPNFTSVQQTGNFTGVTYIDACATCAVHDNASTGTEGSGTARVRLFDYTANSFVDLQYEGGGGFNQGLQISLTIPRAIFRSLNPAHVYFLLLECQKGTGVGQTQIFDSYIFGLHNGSNQ